MIPWKDRLYAFLFSHVLGPWLDDKSLQLLHQSIEISLQEGKLVLKNIELNTRYLTEKLALGPAGQKWKIMAATLERLDLTLSLEEVKHYTDKNGDDYQEEEQEQQQQTSEGTSFSSFAWKAMNLGTTSPTGGQIALIARLVLDGIAVSVEPNQDQQQQATSEEKQSQVVLAQPRQRQTVAYNNEADPEKKSDSTAFTATARHMLKSYMEAALASLRLSVQINQLTVRIHSQQQPSQRQCSDEDDNDASAAEQEDQPWLELRIKAISYHDVVEPTHSKGTAANVSSLSSSYKTIIHKAFNLSRISISIGSTRPATAPKTACGPRSSPTTATMILLDGVAQVRLRVIEYNQQETPTVSSSIKKDPRRVQQDIQVHLGQRLNLFADAASIQQVHQLIASLRRITDPKTTLSNGKQERLHSTDVGSKSVNFSARNDYSDEKQEGEEEAREDLRAIRGIIEQYNQARARAERHEVRGGLLLPDITEGVDGGADVTFDAFFDANDQSFYRYSTMMASQSAMLSGMNSPSSLTPLGREDWVHTKLTLDLNSLRAKIAFACTTATTATTKNEPQEYILATLDELHASSSLSTFSSNHALSLSHFEIEEASRVAGDSRRTKIGNVLSFMDHNSNMQNSNSQPIEEDEVLLQAPCLSVNVTTSSATRSTPTTTTVELDIEPFLLTCSHPVLSNMIQFLSDTQPLGAPGEDNAEPPALLPPADSHAKKNIKSKDQEVNSDPCFQLRASCAHLDVVFPVEEVPVSVLQPLFARSCVVGNDFAAVSNQSSLGIRVERLLVETSSGNKGGGGTVEVGFLHIVGYTYFHSLPDASGVCRMLDLFALGGGDSDAVLRICSAGNHGSENPAVKVFPRTPAVSSFKARQDDEDENSPTFSPSNDFEIVTRSEIRGPDALPQMLQAVSRATKSFELRLSYVSMDVSLEEIPVLMKVLKLPAPPTPQMAEEKRVVQATSPSGPFPVESFTVTVDHGALALHDKVSDSLPTRHGEPRSFSYLLEVRQFCVHFLLCDGELQHARLLTHDTAFHEVMDLVCNNVTNLGSWSLEERVELLRRRLWITPKTNATPLLHRSHLFPPISRKSPSVLFDIVKLAEGSGGFSQTNVHITLYDLTHRFDYDSRWLVRIKSMVQRLLDNIQENTKVNDQQQVGVERTQNDETMTRLFLCIADCNIDYTSPVRWETPSRSIIRLGEIRVSCNLISPVPALQAIKLSVGDISLCLCNTRFPYTFENSKLWRSEESNFMEDVPLSAKRLSDEVLRDMNFRTIAMLDSLNAILTIANPVTKERSRPGVHVALTIGEFSLFACKDSMAVFLNSVGDFCTEACAMDDETFQNLKQSQETFCDSMPHEVDRKKTMDSLPQIHVLEDLMRKSALRPSVRTAGSENSFLLDGYDWTTIDHDEPIAAGIPPNDEQCARWYGAGQAGTDTLRGLLRTGSTDSADPPRKDVPFQIISHHFPLQPTCDPLADGDMGAAKYAGVDMSCPPTVKARVTVTDLSLKFRLFDGYDWPECLREELRNAPRKGTFLIDVDPKKALIKPTEHSPVPGPPSQTNQSKPVQTNRKTLLMADLLDVPPAQTRSMFENLPLPEERSARLKRQAELRRIARRSDKYIQFSANGIQLRTDLMEGSDNHRLASCLDVKARDFFFAETISCNKPIKLAGEWLNDADHPRDSRDGLFMLKMITWNAETRVNRNDQLEQDLVEAAMKILPLRCLIDQKAVRFITAFFMSDCLEDEESKREKKLPPGLHPIPPPRFRKFVARPLKLKVNYKPEKLDQAALRNGQIVELLNLTPLENLVLTTDQVETEDVIGFGGVVSVLVPRWIQHVSSTQLLKFLKNTKPLEPFTTVGDGLSDMIVLPWEAIKNGGDVRSALRAGASSFGRAVAYEGLTLSSEAAAAIAAIGAGRMLPQRPLDVPTGVQDTADHIVESLARGFQAANSTIIIIPYREYQRNGATGMLTSVIRGIPVAVAAPAGGAAEALSYALIGIRNQLRPDIRREEEASQRGLRFDG